MADSMTSVYVIVHDCGLNGADIEPRYAFSSQGHAQRWGDYWFDRDPITKEPRSPIVNTTGYGGWEVVEVELLWPGQAPEPPKPKRRRWWRKGVSS